MRGLLAAITLWATLVLVVPSALAGANDQSEKTIPQDRDAPGSDNGQQIPPSEDEEVIPPPPVGDEGIYTDAPNPHAGHEKEVIPPPSPSAPFQKPLP
jgi:hypothetical protein